jgi:hypothetical protein
MTPTLSRDQAHTPTTCPQDLSPTMRGRTPGSPAYRVPRTIGSACRRASPASLRSKEVLRAARQHGYLQGLCKWRGELDGDPDAMRRCSAVLFWTTKIPRFPGISLLSKPPDGLEPSTPSLPWRIRAAGGGLRNSACYGVFPATTPFRLPDAPLPPRALSLPEKPRTCPQNPSPRKTRPSLWWTPSAKRLRRGPRARSLLHRRKAEYREDAS